jgi:hypothetical protein
VALDPDFTAWAKEACGLQEGVSAPIEGSSSIPGKKYPISKRAVSGPSEP